MRFFDRSGEPDPKLLNQDTIIKKELRDAAKQGPTKDLELVLQKPKQQMKVRL
ncbi:hypothetical protein LEP1GSC047_1968 [Leptospira inadai serovar Lyme str. 10]|uniref:Uncharacterized protein n=1 Tax=Leptospira inadai serovar Lyme str. 10 TaxID=1049790 RepID=V6HSH1_9LEPT|nr:hypothetical protein LEP1GSC047_1968 [Leptospira inadai serovar Lyme str. 10]